MSSTTVGKVFLAADTSAAVHATPPKKIIEAGCDAVAAVLKQHEDPSGVWSHVCVSLAAAQASTSPLLDPLFGHLREVASLRVEGYAVSVDDPVLEGHDHQLLLAYMVTMSAMVLCRFPEERREQIARNAIELNQA